VIEPLAGSPGANQCIGYAQFVQRLEGDPEFLDPGGIRYPSFEYSRTIKLAVPQEGHAD
jgi:hypothetical protein